MLLLITVVKDFLEWQSANVACQKTRSKELKLNHIPNMI